MSMSVGAELDQVLDRHRIGLTSHAIVAELDAALAAVGDTELAPLSAAETEFLRKHGGPRAAEVVDSHGLGQDRDDAAREAGARVADLAGSTLSVAEAALRLGVDRSRISHRLAEGSLWAFFIGRSPRLPRWQFLDGAVLPGLDAVVSAIPVGLAPPALARFMTTPQAELDGATPRAYLAEGGDPAPVAQLVADLGLW
jgi:hypothetical protein